MFYNSETLYHHGILGQKWGKRNGPPYPLDPEDHSKTEKEAAKKKIQLSDKTKKAIKIGAAIVATGLIAYGGYKFYQNRGMIQNYARLGKKNVDFIRNSHKFDSLSEAFGSSDIDISNVGLSPTAINEKLVERINGKYRNTVGGNQNCTHATIAYLLDSLFGKNYTAKPFSGIDEISGMVANARTGNMIHAVFDNVKSDTLKANSFLDTIKMVPSGTTGALGVWDKNTLKGHMIAYEKDSHGIITLIDNQKNLILDSRNPRVRMYLEHKFLGNAMLYDLSESNIRDNIDDVLKYLVE